jgi:hypothetical protein
MPSSTKTRKRMIVEEVKTPVEEIKEKVEEPQIIADSVSELVEKPEEVQDNSTGVVEEKIPTEEKEKLQEEKPQEEKPLEKTEPVMPTVKKSNGTNPIIIIIPGIFLLGALLGGIVFYQRGISSGEPTPTPDYSNTITPSPTMIPETTLDLTKYPINVKNGSGVSGQAGVVKSLLETAGFKVSGTGNATSYDFTKTVIKTKADVPEEFLTKLSEALSKNYVLDTNQSLATSSANEVEVIVGSTKAK